MKTNHRYRQFVAAIFLLLYGFIATPVQAWHHHENGGYCKSSEVKISKEAGDDIPEGECKICKHTYPAYLFTEATIHFAVQDHPIIKNPLHPHYHPSHFIARLSNKGPPTLLLITRI